MRSVLAVICLVFAANCFAAPAPEERQVFCTFELSSRFGLSASRFGHEEIIPLGLGMVNGTTGNAFLSTQTSNGVFFLLQSGRIPALQEGHKFRGVSIGAEPGTHITFIDGPSNLSERLGHYCAQREIGLRRVHLGVDSNIRGFALCKSSSGNVVNVVYRPTRFNDGSYRFDTCVGALVRIHERSP